MNAIITIVDKTSETSMAFNEFVLYRATHYLDEKQILVVVGEKAPLPKVEIPSNMEVHYTGKNIFLIRHVLKDTIHFLNMNKIPYAVHLHLVKSAWFSQMMMLGTGMRKKTVFTVHNTFPGYELRNKIQSYINALFAEYITCVGNYAFSKYPQTIKMMKKERIVAIQNGVDVERIDRVLNNNRGKVFDVSKNEKLWFIYIARLAPEKNHQFLIDVIKDVDPKVQFIFIGKEGRRVKIKKAIIDAGIRDRVILTGVIPRDRVFQYLQNADAYVSTSVLEGMPISVLEAMCVGVPVVLSDIAQHLEIVGDLKSARLLPFEKERWVDELNRLANMSQNERQELGKSNRDYILHHFSLKKMHMQYDRIYKDIWQRQMKKDNR